MARGWGEGRGVISGGLWGLGGAEGVANEQDASSPDGKAREGAGKEVARETKPASGSGLPLAANLGHEGRALAVGQRGDAGGRHGG